MSNFVAEFMIVYETMTLRELLQSVDAEAYASIPLYDELLKTKPEYGSDNRIEVKVLNGEIAVSNVHIGSFGDIVACPVDVAPDLQITKMQLLDAILKEMFHEGFTETDADDFWDYPIDPSTARLSASRPSKKLSRKSLPFTFCKVIWLLWMIFVSV